MRLLLFLLALASLLLAAQAAFEVDDTAEMEERLNASERYYGTNTR